MILQLAMPLVAYMSYYDAQAEMYGDPERLSFGGLAVKLLVLAVALIVGRFIYDKLGKVSETAGTAAAVVSVLAIGIGFSALYEAASGPRWNEPRKASAEELLASPVNINTARRSELEAVPGIGPIIATRIIDGRPWRRVEDLQHLRGVKHDKFEAMRPYLTAGISLPPEPTPTPAPTVQIKNDTDMTLRVLFMDSDRHKLIVERTIGPHTKIEQPHLDQSPAYVAVMNGSTEICSGTYFRNSLGFTIYELQGQPKLLESSWP